MWKKIVTVIAVILLVAGIGLFSFPIVSNFIGTQISKGETERFDRRLESVVEDKTFDEALSDGEIDEEGCPVDENGKRKSDTPLIFKPDLDRLYKASKSYNEELKSRQSSLLVDTYSYEQPSLNLRDYGISDGIYGYVSAESIGMKLPVYLGANNSNMSYGAAHLTYTSLPIGGESTNSVLAGHTGYVGRIFFDNLRKLKIGDEIKLRNFWDTLSYRVAETKVCKPEESQDVFLQEGKDILTMITCIGNSEGGFDRYYVICERIKSSKNTE